MKNIKRIVAALLVAVMLMTGAALASGKIKTEGKVNLRKGPGLDYAEVKVIKAGKTAKYLGTTKKDARGVAWYKVSFNNKIGWVSSKYGKLIK